MTNDQRKANVDLGAFWIQRSNSILMERDKTQKSLRKASRASFYMANISWNSYDSRDRFDCFETFRLIIIFFCRLSKHLIHCSYSCVRVCVCLILVYLCEWWEFLALWQKKKWLKCSDCILKGDHLKYLLGGDNRVVIAVKTLHAENSFQLKEPHRKLGLISHRNTLLKILIWQCATNHKKSIIMWAGKRTHRLHSYARKHQQNNR